MSSPARTMDAGRHVVDQLRFRSGHSADMSLAKKQALEALALAQFGLEHALAAIEEAKRRLQDAEELPPQPLPPPVTTERPQALPNPNQLLRLSEVKQLVGLSGSAIYRRLDARSFPSSVSVGPRSVRWRRRDVEAWLASLTSGGSAMS